MPVTSTRISSRNRIVVPIAPADKPLYAQTKALFDAMAQHRLDVWAQLVDEELDLVDVAPDGRHVVLRSRGEVEAWLRDRFHACRERGVCCETELLEYDAVLGHDLAFSTAYFKLTVCSHGERILHYGAATIVWCCDDEHSGRAEGEGGGGWKVSRWHCTVERTDSETLPSFA